MDKSEQTEQQAKVKKQINTPPVVVALGASAGGLEALQDFFKAVDPDTSLAFVVIQHLSPDYKSLMDELLARYTELPIHIIEDGMKVEANHVYLIPPRKNLSIFQNQLFLDDQNPQKGLNLPIDIFFRSLAKEKGRDSIGVILSGTGSDGTLGTRAIKEAGGMIMVQDELTAKFDGMPRSSIATGLVDYVLPPHRMPVEIMNYTRHPFVNKDDSFENILTKNVDSLTKVILILRDYSGIDFSYYKQNTIVRRLERRVSINRFNTIEEYVVYLSESDKEKDTLYREMLIGVTRFFRDHEAFTNFRKNVIPKIFKERRDNIRIWSAGCSTGEEVYSVAMLFEEYREKHGIHCEVKIFATDIDRHSLEIAGQGFYPDSIVSDIDGSLLAKYFTRHENGYRVNESIRKMVVFATHNLLKDPPFSKLDLLICRNLFIYFKTEMQQRLLSMFYYSLNPEGYLFLGSSETIGEMKQAFNSTDIKWKIYQYKSGYKPPIIKNIPSGKIISQERDMLHLNRSRLKDGLKFEKILESVLSMNMPPSVIVDESGNIVHVINDINKFITIPPGKFSQNLLSVLPKELSLFVNNLLRRLKTENKTVLYRNIAGLKGVGKKNVSLQGKCIRVDNSKFCLISFIFERKKSLPVTKDVDSIAIEKQISNRMTDLEKDLQTTRENLQATVEELETSNEELQSSNEELIASNEELQSTNEELQSVNEELYTVNSEYQNKIEELTRLHNDLDNLMRNTEVGALYIDSDMLIRKITPAVSQITNILSTDIGRPVTHLSVMHQYPEMPEDINHVIDTLQPVDKDIVGKGGENYFVRIRPYRTEKNAVDGIVITFVDITKLKAAEDELRMNRNLLNKVLEHNPVANVLVNANGKIHYANRPAEMIFGITREQIMERTYDSSKWKSTDLAGKPLSSEQLPFSKIKKSRKPLSGFRHYIEIPGKKKQLLNISGAPVIDDNGVFEGVVFSIQKEKQ